MPIHHQSDYLNPKPIDLLRAKDTIYLNDVKELMRKGFKNGHANGTTTYFKTIDKHFTWRKGEVTVMGGIMNHGKTKMILQLMLLKSIREGDRWGVFSPEQNPPTEFYDDLIHTYIGKNVNKQYLNQMSDDEYERGMQFIGDHFFFVYPENDSPTPEYINERFIELMEKEGITGCLTDPFNQLDNDWKKYGNRDDKYISYYLTQEKRFALKYNVYKLINAHPSGEPKLKADGNEECPSVRNLAGGRMWGNKADNILCTYRPYYETDPGLTTTEFRSQKIKKQNLVGIPGRIEMTFDRATNRYLENGKSPFDSTIDPPTMTNNADFFNRGSAQTTPWD